ncbi:hypothetical protein B0H17DRAFT_1198167 [Mycena rosella]|uniref:Uncharacterized protein n=1 Tax=Mycena rosella TaxID=1033263 RepID=A0AAD7DNV1_MYCRO|nr:hypothetical protein B0H17DRAFT_1198167 [Mycena rosella]
MPGAKENHRKPTVVDSGGAPVRQHNPDIPEAHVLRGWYDEAGKITTYQAHSSSGGGGMERSRFVRSEIRSLTDVKQSELGVGDQVDYFSTR